MNKERLIGLEAGRGVAALLVAAIHLSSHLRAAHGPFGLTEMFRFAHAGVDFFFVLSGFIICFVHAGDVGIPERLAHYVKRRITRVFPLLWIVLAVLILISQLKPASAPQWHAVLRNALLLPSVNDGILGPSWTLQHEAIFYAVFATLIINVRLSTICLCAWFAAIVGVTALGMTPTNGLLFRLTLWFDLQFFMGMGAAWFLRRHTVPLPEIVFAWGVAGFLTLGACEDFGLVNGPTLWPHMGYGVAATFIVLGLVEMERDGKLRVPRLLFALGTASYAVYLTHELVIGTLWKGMIRFHLNSLLPYWIQFIGLLLSVAAFGTVIHRVVEIPAIKAARALLDRGLLAYLPRQSKPQVIGSVDESRL